MTKTYPKNINDQKNKKNKKQKNKKTKKQKTKNKKQNHGGVFMAKWCLENEVSTNTLDFIGI